MNPPTRGKTLAELVESRRLATNPTTRWVYSEIIAKRIYRGEAGECY